MRVFLITGASSGIGRSIVVECARAFPKAQFVLTARRADELAATAQLAGLPAARVELVPIDVTAADAPAALVERTRARFGRLDVLVNNAGVGSGPAFEDAASDDATRRVFDVNLVAPILLTRASLELLTASRGSIVNISSVAGMIGSVHSPVYTASKWGITGFADALRPRLAARGVHVASVHPGPVPTPGWPHRALMSRWYARPLYCQPSDIGRAVVSVLRARRASVVRPRIYHATPILRVLAPRLTRRLLRAAARRSTRREARP